ncbi:MAG: serine/threonine-protein kinase [Acidobacteriota bacterium]|nr:serine/threonine-protein kinase [Acidobacteriota bacterium]
MLGKTIGNYRIVTELAKGGMGAVYRAHHLHLPREVVVKSIQLESFSESAQELLRARFRREAFIQSQFDHPNIVRVLEFFEARDNYYLVMEYVPGVSLRELLDKQGIPAAKQAVHLFKQILSALDYAHNFNFLDEAGNRQRGIIHRDINPSNLLLDNNGRIKIADFGTVKAAGATRLTQIGFHPGTLEYMSPEQLRGGEIDWRSDIYSVGVTFYEILTGQLPFPMTEDGADWEVRKGHIELPPPPIQKHNPNVPADLAAMVMRALQKSPEARYQSAAEFLKAINGFKLVEDSAKKKQRGHARKFSKFKPAFASPVIKLDPTLFPQRLENLFEASSSAMVPVAPRPLANLHARTPIAPKTPGRNFQNAYLTNSDFPSTTSSGLLKRIVPLIAQYKFGRATILQASLLFGAALVLILFSLDNQKPDLQHAMANLDGVSATKSSTSSLRSAQDLETQERYDDAILAYESVLFQSPKEEERDGLTMKIMQLRTFQTLIEAGRIAERGERFLAARQHYFEALQIRPNSELARTRLAEIEQRLTQPHSLK